MSNRSLNISIAGSGRVARAMGRALKSSGHTIVQVISRNEIDGQKLADKLGAEYITYSDNVRNVDLIALLVSDDAISEVSSLLPSTIPQFHSSGVTSIDVISSEVAGVVWPIKSINEKSTNSNFNGVPIGIESTTDLFKNLLLEMAISIGGDGFEADSRKRSIIHLAAVFTDNFANHCLTLSQSILKNSNLDPSLMRALASGLLEGALNGDSESRQTGVAIRGDLGSQKKHIELLDSDSEKAFYKFLSEQIKNHHEL